MSLLVGLCKGWLRRRSLVGVGLVLLGAAGLWWHGGRLPLPERMLLWMFLLLVGAVLLRRRRFTLLGPVLFYDLIRTARRGRPAAVRCCYAAILLSVLFLVYAAWFSGAGDSIWNVFRPWTLRVSDMPRFAESFFATFTAMQFAAVLLLTPAYTAGAIAEEKERRTLEFLLVTDLRDHEIVLGKLASRLANLALVLLTGLPILSLTQFLGGVDPDLVLAGFAVTGLTMFSLASLSILISVQLRKSLSAVICTYLSAALFLLVTAWPPLRAGNPFVAVHELEAARRAGLPAGAVLSGLVRSYAIFHLLAAAACGVLAARRLRSVFLRQANAPARRGLPVHPAWPARRPRPHPQLRRPLKKTDAEANRGWGPYPDGERPQRHRDGRPAPAYLPAWRRRVGEHAMLWKEIQADLASHFHPGNPLSGCLIGVGILLGLSFLGVLLISVAVPSRGTQSVNLVVRFFGTGVACLLLLVVAFWAARTVSREREQQTLDGLLTTPLSNEEILYAKWLGSILSGRWSWWFLGFVWIVGVLSGALHVLALPLLVAGWMVYASFLAALGLFCSSLSHTTMQATFRTVAALIAVIGVFALFAMYGDDYFAVTLSPGAYEAVHGFLLYGLTPPMPLVVLAFHSPDLISSKEGLSVESIRAALAGLLCYALAAWLLWRWTLARFGPATGRMPLPRSRRRPADGPVDSAPAAGPVPVPSAPAVGIAKE